MGKAATIIIVVLGMLGACLLGVGVGYIAPRVYENIFVLTPSTGFRLTSITFEELRMKEAVTVQDIVSAVLSATTQTISPGRLNLALEGKNLQEFQGSVISFRRADTAECNVVVHSDDYPAFYTIATVSGEWCNSLRSKSKVVISGTIMQTHHVEDLGMFQVQLYDVGLAER